MKVIYRDIVGAFIFSNDGFLLLGKSNRGTYEGMWLIPGGGVEEGESKEQAVIREVQEEVGLDISDESLEYLDETLTGESTKILKETGEKVLGKYKFFDFVIKINKNADDIEIKSQDDFADATWHSVDTLNELQLPPPSVSRLKKLGYI